MATGRILGEKALSLTEGRLFPIAFSFGISIMILAYSIGHLTGGHMNPAVSLMMVFKRQMSVTKMVSYWIAQFVGATLGAALVWGSTSGIQGNDDASFGGLTIDRPPLTLGVNSLDSSITVWNGFLLEFMGSFVFFFVIAQTALDKRGIGSTSFPAIPIGFSLIVVHLCLIPFTGCGKSERESFSVWIFPKGGDN
jgi:aquaporin Z